MKNLHGRIKNSQFTRFISLTHDKSLIFHSLAGNPTIIDSGARKVLEAFRRPRSFCSFRREYEIDRQTQETISILVANKFLVSQKEDERETYIGDIDSIIRKAAVGGNLRVLDLSVSECCNFGCKYCIHSRALDLDSSRIGRSGFMTVEMAKTAIDTFLGHMERIGVDEWSLHFGSAEPLLNFKVVQWAIDYLKEIKTKPVDISINSNLSLLTEEMAVFFRDNNFRVNTSIDGLPGVNDTVRVYKTGKGTAGDIIRGIKLIKSVGHHVNGIGVTLCDINFDAVGEEIVDWLERYQIPNVLFDIDSVNMVEIDVEEAAEKFVRFEALCRAVGIRVDGCWKTAYENIRDSGVSGIKSFCASLMGNNLLVAPSGNLYYCTYSATPLGHITDFPKSLEEGPFGDLLSRSFTGNFPECKGCDIEGHCLGGCLLTREGDENQQKKVDQMCRFYRSATIKLLALDAKDFHY